MSILHDDRAKGKTGKKSILNTDIKRAYISCIVDSFLRPQIIFKSSGACAYIEN